MISVIVPSRGRPENIRRLVQAFEDTCDEYTQLVVVLDHDDDIPAYMRAIDETSVAIRVTSVLTLKSVRPGIVWPLNTAWQEQNHLFHGSTIVGWMGDDHLPRTRGWDTKILNKTNGISYGNDLLMGAFLPTAAFMKVEIPLTLGWIAPPSLAHLYVDNFYYDLGKAIGRLTYFPELIFEHMHFSNGKAGLDTTYREANDPNILADKVAYSTYKKFDFPDDVSAVLRCLDD